MDMFKAVVAAMASFFVVTLVLAAVLIICKNNSAKSRARSRNRHHNRNFDGWQTRSISNANLGDTNSRLDESLSFDPSLQISMDKIVDATRNFSPDLIVGDGSFGLVYRAQMPDGRTVAIKKLDPDAFQGIREFRAEIETLGKLHHKNLVRILGFSVSGADRILIYEYVERGNLDFWLHDEDDDGSRRLPWPIRTKIVRGVAEGLAYLHSLDNPIIHRDIKASNVLLDSDFEARISDFGLARTIDSSHSHVSTQVAGTMGYMPPEYKEGFTLATVKADVYSFGVLMLEIAIGRRPNLPLRYQDCENDGNPSAPASEMGLVQWARKMIASGRHMEMVDPCLARVGLAEPHVVEYFRIACLCANEMFRQRPAMRDVVDLLATMQQNHQA